MDTREELHRHNELAEAVAEVTQTVLLNPGFFPARDRLEVRSWVKKLFPNTPHEAFDQVFQAATMAPELNWGRRRFYVVRTCPKVFSREA